MKCTHDFKDLIHLGWYGDIRLKSESVFLLNVLCLILFTVNLGVLI